MVFKIGVSGTSCENAAWKKKNRKISFKNAVFIWDGNYFLPKIKNRYFRTMILLRKLLFPFAILYGIVTAVRNFMYDKGILKSATFNIPVIAVGNLSVGGTGKTPQIEYLIRLLSNQYKVAVLSRGYKRKSGGFVLADGKANAETLGDEPFQFFTKFPNISVAVDADRKNGIEQLLALQKPEIILLDDAFQHRKVKAGFYILLTSYGDLYADDFVLPTGNLRECRSGAKRADVVIVTKCPETLTTEAQNEIRNRLKLDENQELYFTFIDYDDKVYSEGNSIEISDIRQSGKILVAGIARPKPFFDYLKGENNMVLEFPDHHDFTENEIADIKSKAANEKIITTEKDFMRLKDSILESQLYYLPIKSAFVWGSGNFDKIILDYVGKTLNL
jgi:tetraacyldisaccharide 4'-kinase